ncbi:AaceriAFR373Wp [[Ashbya] aceris (nom. inval.)]|nr:AaceriAFR373Wp [[Ashbya] aceris (nom. inval.)]
MDDLGNHTQLRPYYDPETFNAGYTAVFKPERGVVDACGQTIAAKLNTVAQQGVKKFGKKMAGQGRMLSELTAGLKARFDGEPRLEGVDGRVAKGFGQLEWNDLLNYRMWQGLLQRLLQDFLRKYCQHLIQLPFDTARLLLQVGDFGGVESAQQRQEKTSAGDEDSGDEDVDYFPTISSQINDSERWRGHADDADAASTHIVQPTGLHTMDVLNAVMDKEGTRGVWRANNTIFIYNFLSESLDAWFTGLLSPFLQIPDPYFIDIIHSPDVQKSIALTFAAGIFTGLVLLPLDVIKTRLVVGAVASTHERSLRRLVKRWSWREYLHSLPGELVVLNVVNSLLAKAFRVFTSVGLHQQYNIDRFSSRYTFHTLEFLSDCLQLFFKLPVEALLKRAELHYILEPVSPFHLPASELIVRPRAYRNVFVTLREYHRLPELWRGWRIGLTGVVCSHGLRLMEAQQTVLDEEEKF